MDFILDVYRVERAALDAAILGTPEPLELRQTKSQAVLDEFKAWLGTEQPRHPPKSATGEAISYAPGPDDAGEHLAGLYSLIATCEVNGVNPVSYLADILLCVQTHPAARVDKLLPHNWKPPEASPPT